MAKRRKPAAQSANGTAPGAVGSKVPVKLLDLAHEEHQRNSSYWTSIKLLYEGGVSLSEQISQFLFRRPAEPADEYAYRCARFFHVNVLNGLAWYGAKIFKGIPQLVVSSQGKAVEGERATFYQEFVKNCDRGGTPLHRFFTEVFLDALLCRRGWFATDKANIGDVASLSLQQYREAGGEKPYLVHIDPQNVINWGTAESGELEFVVIKTVTTERAFMRPPVEMVNWYHFDRQSFTHYRALAEDISGQNNADAEIVATGPHALSEKNRVPIIRLELPNGLWLANKAYSPCVEHLNKNNELSFGISMGCLIMPVYTSDSEVQPKIGEAAIIKLGKGDSFSWSEPKGEVFRIALEYIRALEENISRQMFLAHQGRGDKSITKMMSGTAMQEDAKPANEILEAFGGIISDAINSATKDIADARLDDVVIELKGFDFVAEISTDRLQKILTVLEEQLGSDTLERELKIELALDAVPNASEATKQTIIAEIKAAPTNEERDAAQAAADQKNRLDSLATAEGIKPEESESDATA